MKKINQQKVQHILREWCLSDTEDGFSILKEQQTAPLQTDQSLMDFFRNIKVFLTNRFDDLDAKRRQLDNEMRSRSLGGAIINYRSDEQKREEFDKIASAYNTGKNNFVVGALILGTAYFILYIIKSVVVAYKREIAQIGANNLTPEKKKQAKKKAYQVVLNHVKTKVSPISSFPEKMKNKLEKRYNIVIKKVQKKIQKLT